MYTRGGDGGETSLYGPRRVRKDSSRVEAYGAVDELNSVLGVALSACRDRGIAAQLREVQRLLFVAGGDLAAEEGSRVPRISREDTRALEAMADAALAKLPSLGTFILPGGAPAAAQLQLARAVCRRAERRVVSASRSERLNPELIPFFNRLSTLLFDLARLANKTAGRKETPWSAGSARKDSRRRS